MPRPGGIEYYYAPISGYAYLGEPRLVRIARAAGIDIHYQPVDMNPVFQAAGVVPPARQSAARLAYRQADMQRIGERVGLGIKRQPAHWPVSMVLPARVILSAGALGLDCHAVSMAVMRGIQFEDQNIADLASMRQILVTADLPADRLIEAAESADASAMLAAATEEAVSRGIFGSPTYVVGDTFFFGQDRLVDLAWHLGLDPALALSGEPAG